MEYSLGSTPKIQQPPNKSHRAKALRVVTSAAAATTNGGNSNGVNGSNSVLAKNTGVCPKCNCKRRHSRTCPFKKKGDDEDDLMDLQVASNASSLFSYLDLVALKRYTKHYRLKTKHNSSKAELANAVRLHFESTAVNEGEVIDIFLMKVKTTGSPQSS